MSKDTGVRTTEGRGRLYDGVIETMGNTPCIQVKNIAPSHVKLYVKAEFFNPAASVKDRLAVNIIEHWPGDGLRAKGLSAGHHHGRQLLD